MSDEPTERDVEALAEVLRAGAYDAAWILYDSERALPRAVLASDWHAERIERARREGAAAALDDAAGAYMPDLSITTRRWLRHRANVLTSGWYAQTRCEAAAAALDQAADAWGRSEAEVDRWLRARATALREPTP